MLDRRDFLKIGAVGGAAAAGACAPAGKGRSGSGAEATGDGVHNVPSFEMEEWTVERLRAAMESGEMTARGIAEAYLERVEAVDRSGPRVNSVLEVNPDALEIAAALDEERAAGSVRGPLHGIPVMIKDNIDTADGMTTTAGSLALEGTKALQDSFVAARLREAGALILAKTNLSEWANFRSERSSSGWSGRGGQTNNPYVLDRNPCGSSSGSGAAVSANLCAVGIGTETDGSVVCPSNACGLVGVKPTVGLVGRSGIVPISHSQDTAGPMCRTVTDAAILLGALTGVDPRDEATNASEGNSYTDYTQFLQADGLAGARIGVWRERFGFHERVDAILEDGIEAMRSAGAEMVDPIEMPSVGEIGRSEYEVLLYEFKADLAAYLATRGDDTPFRTLEGLIRFNEENADRSMPYFQQEIFEQSQEKGPLTDQEYLDALEKCRKLSREDGIDQAMAEHELDAIIGPTGGPAWTTDLINGDRFGGGSSRAAAVSGYAAVTVPAGFIYGLPVGMTFFAGAWSEPTLFKFAYGFEQATQARQAPRFLPRADLTTL